MPGNTPELDLYLPGGGSTGLFGVDETADVDRLNENFQKIDDHAIEANGRLDALEADTGWSTTPLTALSGWSTVARLGVRKVGKLVIASVEVTRTGGSITADASSNITDTAVLSIDAEYGIGVPGALIHSMMFTKAGVAVGAWRLTDSNQFQIETLNTGNSINNGDAIRLYGVWFTP
jgi:hypothetical protein